MQFFTSLALLATVARAIMVTQPAQNAVWTAGQDQTIVWNSVSTDTDTVSVYLVNFSHYPTQSILLKSNVATSSGTLSIDGSYLSAGTGYQINLVPGTNTEQILAQSNQFSIVSAAGSSTTAAAASTAAGTTAAASSSGNALPRSNSTLVSTTSGASTSTFALTGSAFLIAVGSALL